MANNSNGNQFREDEIIILDQLRDGKWVKSIHPKIGGRLRLAHEENDQLSITTEIVRYDQNIAVVRAVTTTAKGSFPGLGIAGVEKVAQSKRRGGDSAWCRTARPASADQRIRPAQSSLRNVCRVPHKKQVSSGRRGNFWSLMCMIE